MNIFRLLLLLIVSCTPPLPEEPVEEEECNGIVECDESGYNCVDLSGEPQCYHCGDLTVLQEFINLNSQNEESNGNSCIDPHELGVQAWKDIGAGKRLILLDLNYIDITSLHIIDFPENIGELDALESFKLNNNQLESLPNGFTNLIQLKHLELENNLLSDLPEDFGNLVNLEELIINDNLIIQLPETFINLVSLEELWAHNNQLENLPESIGNLSKLQWLDLKDNALQVLPSSIGNLENLKTLLIDNNTLYSLPLNLCNIYPCDKDDEGHCVSGLETFSSDNNSLCADSVPECVLLSNLGPQACPDCPPLQFSIEGSCVNESDYNILQSLIDANPESLVGGKHAYECYNPNWWDEGRLVEISFQHKGLTSAIPTNISGWDSLKVLRLTDNDLTGEIPEDITELTNLQALLLGSNNLSGNIPISIGTLINLDSLVLNNNQLGCIEYDYIACDSDGENNPNCCTTLGEIPESITNLVNLKYLRLEKNYYLSGPIPNNIGNLSNLQILRLNGNRLTGEIPESIGNLINLSKLYLQDNDLSGLIPVSLCDVGLTHFYYQGNSFCESLPPSDCASVTTWGGIQSCPP